MTPADTAALRALQGAATPGPWVAQGYDHNPGEAGVVILGGADTAMGSHLTAYAITVFNVGQSEADAAYIAALVNAAPDLLDELDRLREQVARVEAWYGWSRTTDAPDEALAIPADTEGVSRESIEQVRWAEANPDAMALDDVEAARRDAAEGGE